MKSFKNIDAYITSFPKEVQTVLKEMRMTVNKAAPTATEKISYGIPTLDLNGNLVHYAAFKNHIGLYPGPSGVLAFKKELEQYKTSKGAIQFPLGKKLPLSLIAKITKFRVQEASKKK